MIEIYGKDNCPYCDMAKNLAERKNLEYTYYKLGTDFDQLDLFTKFPTARTYPQIKAHGQSIGGYQEFEEWVDGLRRL